MNMTKETSNFEVYINEYEKVTVSTIPNLTDNTIEITGVTLKDDTMMQLADMGENLQVYIFEEAKKYLKLLKE